MKDEKRSADNHKAQRDNPLIAARDEAGHEARRRARRRLRIRLALLAHIRSFGSARGPPQGLSVTELSGSAATAVPGRTLPLTPLTPALAGSLARSVQPDAVCISETR
jgi:hypothetical protein